MKNIFLVVLSLIAVALLVMVISFYQKASKYTKSYEEERYSRMVAEESLQKNAAKLATLEAQLKTANDKMAKVQSLIDQEKSINVDLKKQYDELNKIRSDLQNKLKTTIEENAASAAEAHDVDPINNPIVVPVETAK